MNELVLRFLIGGAVISVFALLGEVLRPKSFAGLFSAAPSLALATVGLTVVAWLLVSGGLWVLRRRS